MQKIERFVMDSAVILNDFNFFFEENKIYYTTPEIINEIKDLRSRNLMESGLNQEYLIILDAKEKFLEKVKEKSKEKKLLKKLSAADLSILALALELKYPLISDDFAIQSMCLQLKLSFLSVFRKKIKK